MPRKPGPSSSPDPVLTENTATPLVGTLPGQAEEDQVLIEAVLNKVNEAYEHGGLKTLREVGGIVLGAMFGGDLERFLAAEKSHVSFRALARRGDLRISASNLWYAVAIEQNFRLLGDRGAGLTASHHRRLVHVRDEQQRLALAERVLGEGLQVDELEEIIQSSKPAEPGQAKRGRPALHPVVKRFSALTRSAAGLGDPTAQAFANLKPAEAAQVLTDAKALHAALAQWLATAEPELASRAADQATASPVAVPLPVPD